MTRLSLIFLCLFLSVCPQIYFFLSSVFRLDLFSNCFGAYYLSPLTVAFLCQICLTLLLNLLFICTININFKKYHQFHIPVRFSSLWLIIVKLSWQMIGICLLIGYLSQKILKDKWSDLCNVGNWKVQYIYFMLIKWFIRTLKNCYWNQV